MTLLQSHPLHPRRDAARHLAACCTRPAWMPAFDIEETDSAYILRGDVPGTTRKDIEIRIDESVLSIRGERQAIDPKAQFRRSERPHGRFVRRFRLPSEVDEGQVEAAFSDGVLKVTLPKQVPEDTSRLIPVH